MSLEHKRIGTLAGKLEYANALLAQLRLELKQERIEHGKTKALIHELEYRHKAAMSEVAKEERTAARAHESVRQMAGVNKKLRGELKACRAANDILRADNRHLMRTSTKSSSTP